MPVTEKIEEKTEEKTKEQRIKTEKNRLNRQFKEINPKKKEIVKGSIERAAFMKVELEDLEADLRENGYTEKFSQGNQEPYDRMRPVANMYNSMSSNYQKIIQQLTGLLPKEKPIEKKSGDDFDEFISSRED